KRIKKGISINADIEVNGDEMALSPGFINVHSHSDLISLTDSKMEHVIRQGITTEIIGQDGSSVAPVTDEILEELMNNMAPLAGVLDKPYWWRSYGEYLNEIKKANPPVKIEGLVGHGTVRMCVMGNENRRPSIDELNKMKAIVRNSINEGAKGLSLGLIYPPGSYADTEELIEICKIVAEYDGIVMVHMRNEQDKILESLDEMIRVAQESKVRIHISHLKALGPKNWGKVRVALEKIEELNKKGLEINFGQYPYEAACTGLKVIVPTWAYEGGEEAFQKRLREKEIYLKVLDEVNKNIEARGGPEKILIAAVRTNENSWMSGKDLKYIAEKLQLSPGETALELLKNEGPSVLAVYFAISLDDVLFIMKSSLQTVCSDGIMGVHPHPRTYGSFPRVLGKYVRELKVMSLEEAIRKMTLEPARRLRLWDRGIIREGMCADLVLFNPETVSDKNTYLEPKVFPEGIYAVWVNGDLKFRCNK
ncbi:MAG: N-acyl-D-amino-acid deacylase family protein, partial [Candidatus Njordarchaeales archaeon]